MLTVSDPAPSGNISIQLIIIAVLMLVNAIFAAAELAILSANETKLKVLVEKNNKKAALVLKLQEDETKLLSTIQVGITLAGFFSSATAASTLSSYLAKYLTIPFANEISMVIITLILSYFTLVFGELFPKRIALKSPEKIAMALARPIWVVKMIFKPIVFILSMSCELLVKIFRLKPSDEKVTEEEVMALVSTAVSDGTMESNEEEMITAVLEFTDLTIKDVMTPRIDISMIDINESVVKIKKLVKEYKYTRIPVYDDEKDKIVGILNIKDMILSLNSNFTKEEFKSVLREPIYVPESMKVTEMLKLFKTSKEHSALVIDESGAISGYVTLEDVIEEITGNIYDEYDEVNEGVKKLNDFEYLVDGNISIRDLNKEAKLNIEIDGDYLSLAGLIINELESLPEVGDTLEYNDSIKMEIVEIENNRISKVRIVLKPNQEE